MLGFGAFTKLATQLGLYPINKKLQLAPSTVAGFGDSIVQYNFIGGLSFTGVWSSVVAINVAGSGYVVNDTINLGNGLTVKVLSVNSGAITSIGFVSYGSIASAPSNPISQVSTSGSGTGASFNATWTSYSGSNPPVGQGAYASAVAVTGTGTGGTYNIGDTITLSTSTNIVLTVTSVSGSNVNGVSITKGGVVASIPSNPVSQASSSGTGTGATFSLTWTNVNSAGLGGAWSLDYVEWECPGGVGIMAYDGTNLTWTPNGLTAGATVNATRSGKLYLPGPVSTPNSGIWINWFVGRGTYSACNMSVDVQANGFQLYTYQSNGLIVNALAQSGQNLKMAVDNNVMRGRKAFFGIGGASSSDFVDAAWQWQQIIADIYVEGLGTNDVGGSTAPATTIAKRTVVWNWVVSQGKILIIEEIPPRLSESITQMEYRHQINQAAFNFTQNNPRCYYSARGRYLQDPISSTGNYLLSPALSADGVHPNGLGGYRGGIPLSYIFSALKPGQVYRTNYGDICDATNNPSGNLLNDSVYPGMGVWAYSTFTATITGNTTLTVAATPTYAGPKLDVGSLIVGAGVTAGTVITAKGTGVGGAGTYTITSSGNVSSVVMTAYGDTTAAGMNPNSTSQLGSGWIASRGSGSNITADFSQIARTDGIPGKWQQVVLTGATTNEYIHITRKAGVILIPGSSIIEAVLEVVVVASSGLNIIDVIAQPNVVSARAGQAFGTLGGDPIAGQKFFLKLFDWPVPATSTGFAPYIRLGIQNGGSATILLGDVYYRVIG